MTVFVIIAISQGTYLGAAHTICNLQYRLNPKSWKLPVVIHNLKGYDGHLIVKALKSEFGKIRVIPQNLEKYLSLSVGQLRFRDSFQFAPQGLEGLSKTLEDDEFRYLVESYTNNHFDLVRCKTVYPYEYMDSFDRFEETELPSQESFYSKLLDSSCSDADYTHALSIYGMPLGVRQMGDYHDMYLQLDVLLLADFFEKFHRTCLDFYKLDPLHYFTTPGLAWDAALHMSRVDLELITNENIYNMVENSIRGGISMISTLHAKANNPRLPSYDPELPRQDLIYQDANNLYHHAMSQYLPTGGFRLLNEGEIEALDLDDLDDEVDLEYPVELHDKHDDYLQAPESLIID